MKYNDKHKEVIIIGAGISGVGAAIKLIEQQANDFLILEKKDDLGGTWRDNTYPGCACDVPSALYSYSFEQKNDWSRVFAGQAEILDYLQATAHKYGVMPFIRFSHEVEKLSWLEEQQLWRVETNHATYTAEKIVSCVGYLHEPMLPNIEGIEQFEGELFHSSRWRHDIDLSDKRVAVIGSGASAVQFVPEIAAKVQRLSLFQRTAHWVLPKLDKPNGEAENLLMKIPFAMRALRQVLFGGFESLGVGFRKPILMQQAQRLAKLFIQSQIKDKALREKVTPQYTLGCKRVLMSNAYYKALDSAKVDVHATGVERIEGNTLYGANGEAVEADVIILGTGFHVTDIPIADKVFGLQGKTLDDHWQGSPEAYKGTVINGFPNFFLILGPNLAIGHNSAFIVIEAQLSFIMQALEKMRGKASPLQVRKEVQQKYNARVQKSLQGTVWNTGGCHSYYIDANGKNSTGFPWSTIEMTRLLNKCDLDNFERVL